MTLFDRRKQELQDRIAPLATRMRPTNLDEYVGQKHILTPGKVLRRAIDEDRLPSMILWGPPGSGKTTLARLVAGATNSHFEQLSAVSSGIKDVRAVMVAAGDRLGQTGRRTILFIDEIHRFSKSQQDGLLPHVEDGTVTLIGATTENPSFEVISPLLSRTRVYRLEPLQDEDLTEIIERALTDEDHGLGREGVSLSEDAMHFLLRVANGDARSALNTLELAVESTQRDDDGKIAVEVETMEEAVQRQSRYDRLGDMHYDTISAFIKTIRASDPDAALYYLARMIDAGEDPVFIARRLVISAAEDIGLGNPNALAVAMAAQQAVSFVGMPEGRIPLAEATIYLATAPKSNSAYKAIDKALEFVRSSRDEPVPQHLRNAPTRLMKDLGFGEGYEYPHDKPGHFVQADNLPEAIKNARFYEPGDLGSEQAIRERLLGWWGERYKDSSSK
ncbi:MAG TPA: replication-associated recombination protein A [Dehalococcoidia bacterium]|jgi:putative ATPase|nr:replication-associated recombination protein A [Dehalococcoidia bacterium]HIK88631.1 replication-associated recombination protein A [Dehalococcoidia bacterium]